MTDSHRYSIFQTVPRKEFTHHCDYDDRCVGKATHNNGESYISHGGWKKKRTQTQADVGNRESHSNKGRSCGFAVALPSARLHFVSPAEGEEPNRGDFGETCTKKVKLTTQDRFCRFELKEC